MTEEGKKFLSDVVLAIQLIEQFIKDIDDFEYYKTDMKTQSAVERQLVVIGEAINKFRKIERNVDIKHDKQIVAFRNRLVHAYDHIDDTIVWAIMKNHLPNLKKEIKNILSD